MSSVVPSPNQAEQRAPSCPNCQQSDVAPSRRLPSALASNTIPATRVATSLGRVQRTTTNPYSSEP